MTSTMDERERLELAIAAQSTLRGSILDEIVDATITALEERLAAPDVIDVVLAVTVE